MQFHRIQDVAKIKLPCKIQQAHKCTPTCQLYGIHDLCWGYATANCDRMPLPVPQMKMRYRDVQATMRYLETERKMERAGDAVYVPKFLKAAN